MHSIPRLVRWLFCVALFLLLLMSILRMATYFYFAPPSLSLAKTWSSFALGLRYDAREVAVLCLLLFLLSIVPATDPFTTRRGRIISRIVLFLFIAIFLILYVCDFLHFRYLLQRLNASALSFLDDAKISGAMVWQTYPVLRILLGIVVGFIIFYWLLVKIFSATAVMPYRGTRTMKIVFGVSFFLLCGLAIFGRAGQFPLRWSDAFDLGSDFQANLALNPFQSFFSSLSFRHSSFNLQKVKQDYSLVANYLAVDYPDSSVLNYQRKVEPHNAAASKPNIVMVICESFSAYKSSMWGNPLDPTPYFNELCKSGLFFDNCFTPSFGTARGVWASITGITDVEVNKTASRNPAMVDQHSIINDFTGYGKYYFLGGSTSWANIRGVLANNINGLHIFEQDDYTAPKVDVWGISDRNLFKEAGNRLKGEQQPFFAVIQTADNHRPYTIPAEDLKEFKKLELPLDTLKKYGFESNDEFNAFRFTDFCFKSFVETVRTAPWFEHTIFMFVGDHGISGNAGNMFPTAWSEEGLTRNHVPLLFYAPSLIAPARLHCIASQVDVLPTLAGLANIGYTNTTLGRDLRKQYAIDSGKNNLAFIYDANNQDLGVINGFWYYSRNQQGSQEKLSWADFGNPPQVPNNKDSIISRDRKLTEAWYETSRYLLLHNKKQR